MKYVKRANVVLEVEDDSVQHYLDLGYSVIDENGNVLMKAIPLDVGELRKFYVDGTAKIEELQNKIQELEAEIEKLKARPKPGRKPQNQN